MDDRCRLCLAVFDDLTSRNFVNLFDQSNRPHLVADKLRQFVNLDIHPSDNCSKKVCRNCAVNLDFCIQFVDRCRRVHDLVNNGEKPENIEATVTSHYPYLYKTSTTSPSQNENRQTVPFEMGKFFGPTNNFVSNEEPSDSMVVEVEPHTILTPHHNHQPSKCNKKVRKILPKYAEFTSLNDVKYDNVKTAQNGQFLMPVSITTNCKTCQMPIKANDMFDIQNHVCLTKAKHTKNVPCSEEGCDRKFHSQVNLQFVRLRLNAMK